MSVLKHSTKIIGCCCLITASEASVWGTTPARVTAPQTSVKSCDSGGCLVSSEGLKPGVNSLPSASFRSDEALTLSDVHSSKDLNAAQIPLAERTVKFAQKPEDEVTASGEQNSLPKVPVLKPADDPIGDYLQKQNSQRSSETGAASIRQPSFEIGLPLLMDDRYLGDITVRVIGEVVKINGRSLLRLLKPDLTQQALRNLESLMTEEFLIVEDIDIEGLIVEYDSALQQVVVNTPIDSRQQRVLRLGSEPINADIALQEPGNTSFFVTPIISSLYDWNGINGQDKGFQDLRGSLDIGGRVFGQNGISFLSRQSFSGGSDGRFIRNETTAYYDRLDKLRRISVGDLRPRGLGFQSTPRMAGISIERFFNLEPNRLFRPTADSSFELERPSTVDVRLNGVTRREIVLQPGRYNISDLPLVQGSNLVDLVIRDDLGQERIISDQSFFDFGLLEVGMADYSLSAGVKADTTNTGVVYSDDFAATGFYRRGISKNLTLAADIQGDSNGGNTGLSALMATAFGVFRAEVSASNYNNIGSGQAAEIGYRYLGGSKSDWSFSLTGNARHLSENFSTLRNTNDASIDINQIGQDFIIDPSPDFTTSQPFSTFLNGSARLRKDRVTVSAAATHNIGRGDISDRTNFIGGLTYQFNNRMSLATFARYSQFDNESETAASIQLNYRFGRGRTLRANYDSGFDELDVQYSNAAANGVGSLSYSVSARNNFTTDSRGMSGNAFYTGNRFEVNLDHNLVNQGGANDDDLQQFSQASVSTSLVFVDGAFGLGRPVQSTFAILEPHPSLEGRRVLINPTESGYNASSDFLGPAIASEGQAFSTRSTYYDVENLPVGYDLGEGQYSTRAPLYAGYKVQVGSGASFTVMGQLIDQTSGEALAHYGGRLESLSNPSIDPIPAFSNRNGRLAATGVKPGRYKLVLFNAPGFEKIITISENDEPLIHIGDVEVAIK